MDPNAGLYGAAELGLNLIQPRPRSAARPWRLDSSTRIGANLGVGYVISKELPIDIRAQFTMFNLLLKEDVAGTSEKTQFGLGISGGYTFQF